MSALERQGESIQGASGNEDEEVHGLRRLRRMLGQTEERWEKLLPLAILVGLLSGGSGVGLRAAVHELFHSLEPLRQGRLAPLLPALGALLGVFVVAFAFRERGGHGVPEVIRAVCRRGGSMSRRSMLSRWLGSLATVGSGGSAGLEGPIVYSGAAIGSAVGGWFHLDERRRAVLLACGVAGGISGVFNAPMTGMVFSMEVVLAEWSAFSIVPVVVGAVAATELARYLSQEWLGLAEPFAHVPFSMQTWDLVACVALGLFAGGASTALTRAIAFSERIARRLPRAPWSAPLLFGISVGLIGWQLPETIGEGYGTVSLALQDSLPTGVLLCFALLLGKLVTTGLTLGSGAPGGIFAPSLVAGALLGVTFARAMGHLLPGTMPLSNEGSYAIVGMAGMVAGVMQAPLTGILLVMEVTSGYEVILPLMIVSVTSLIVARRFDRYSLYTREVAETGELLRPGTDRRILADLHLIEILDEDVTPVPDDLSLAQFVRVAKSSHRNHFPVLRSGSDEYLGMLELSFVREILLDPELARVTMVGTMMDSEVPTLPPDATLASALEVFEKEGAWVLPVVEGQRFVGLASKAKIFDHYRRELSVQTAG